MAHIVHCIFRMKNRFEKCGTEDGEEFQMDTYDLTDPPTQIKLAMAQIGNWAEQ